MRDYRSRAPTGSDGKLGGGLKRERERSTDCLVPEVVFIGGNPRSKIRGF